jgi:hypothetical protein
MPKRYLENICKEIMEFHRTGHYDLMYMKTKELGWKETQGIQNIGIKGSQGNRNVEQSQVLKIWENYTGCLGKRYIKLTACNVRTFQCIYCKVNAQSIENL